MVALLVVLSILTFVTVDYLVQRRRRAPAAAGAAEDATPRATELFGRAGYRIPHGVFFDPGHTWLYLEETGAARVGVDDFAHAIVGNVDRIDTRPVGREVRKGDVIISMFHGDRKLSFRSPVDGVIEEVHGDILGRKELLSIEPHSASWIYRIRPRDPAAAIQGLMLGKIAKEWLQREVARMKVFLTTLAPLNPAVGVTMQDGGLPAYGLVDFLGDEEWQKVRSRFFK
jgi:glycine cleavage system H protein